MAKKSMSLVKKSTGMVKKSSKQVSSHWDIQDKHGLGLYGINLDNPAASKPSLGSSFRPVMTVGGETKSQESTPANMAAFLGYMDWMEPIVKKLTQVKLPPDQFQQLIAMCQKGSREKLEPRLAKWRRALHSFPQPLYLYCVSEVKPETDMVSGRPFLTKGERVLCILPKTPQVAQHYRYSESEIALLAPQVMWLVTVLLTGQRAIYTQAQLEQAIDGWTSYLSPATNALVLEYLQQKHPQLVSAQVVQLLLQKSQLLLREPQE